jgi:hypothetical protein
MEEKKEASVAVIYAELKCRQQGWKDEKAKKV